MQDLVIAYLNEESSLRYSMTHGGQFLPWGFFVQFQQPFTAGLQKVDQMWVYVSRGTGYWGPPKRFGAPSEITELRLVASAV